MTDLSFIIFDPFTFAALIAIAAWLDRRLRGVEAKVAYERGFLEGQKSLRTLSEEGRAIEE